MTRNLLSWPVLRQFRGSDRLGRGEAAYSETTRDLTARTETADRVVGSVCPYCAVGCAQQVFVKDGKVIQIEGDPDSPVSRGRLCPKGSATLQLTTGESRSHQVLYRRPHARDWEPLDLETAMDMVADRVVATREATWQEAHEDHPVNRTMGIASLGGATLDNEENYLIKKFFTALGVVQVENQARVCHSSTVVALGTSFGRGGSTTSLQDLQHADCIVIEGSNFAECHPVGFQWVMEAKLRGATIIHVDPRYTRTSALADVHVPIRAGTDVAFLGGLIRHVMTNDLDFRDYVVNYTNASTLINEDYRDTEDLDGLFSGFNPETRHYDHESWQYEGMNVPAASGDRDEQYERMSGEGSSVSESGHGESHGSGGPALEGSPVRDETLQHPRCVWQIVKRHYERYTPELVAQVCGIPEDLFRRVADAVTSSSGPDRTTAFAYALGWTQHTTGAQNIRAASILQLLLGNIGRRGGGIMALRGHASIQGSSDIPTLFDLLPGYLPMPHAHKHDDFDHYLRAETSQRGFWHGMPSYLVSLLKAYWGEHATADNDYCFGYLPRLTGAHGTYQTVAAQIDGDCKGYFLFGENPAVGSANARMQRLGMANLDWLVVRDFSLIESATWWQDGPEIVSGELRTADIGTEVFFFPAATHTEKEGTFTNTNRLLQWHHLAVEPAGDARSDLWFMYHLGRRIKDRLATSTKDRDRPVQHLTWDLPTTSRHDEPSAEAVLKEINGYDAQGKPLSAYTQLKDDGSTSCGCWIYCGVYADGVNQSARRTPAKGDDGWLGLEWGWAWPANRHILYNRASADPDGRPWSDDKSLVWWDDESSKWTGHDVPDFKEDKAPWYEPPEEGTGPDGLSGSEPFIMQADGRGWLFAPTGVVDGPLPTHYEPQDSPVRNTLHPSHSRSPARGIMPRPENPYHPSAGERGDEVFPYVLTTYRVTEHFTAGGMTRWTPYLAELQPELFCEVSPELAAERGLGNGGWATIVTARGAIEVRVLVTSRMRPLEIEGRTIHQIGVPFHWGPNGLSKGDAVNELTAIALDPTAHIQEDKALTVDIRPGRKPTGAALPLLVQHYRDQAHIDERTGTEV